MIQPGSRKRAWLQRARQDLRAAKIDLQARPPLVEDALFHAQQAVEKLLKALLTWHDEPFRKTHDLNELGQACVRKDPSLAELLREAADLTAFATVFRYPGPLEQPSEDEANRCLALAKSVWAAVLERLPPSVPAS